LLDAYLSQIAQPEIEQRRTALSNLLEGIGVRYEIQDSPANLIVPMHHNVLPYILIGAHYENLGESFGANNNASGVAIALGLLRVFHFIQARKQRPLPLEFSFFDGQIDGSYAYSESMNPQQLYAMLNLNLCGVGDTVLMAAGKHVPNSPVEKALRRLDTSPHQPSLQHVQMLPPSSEVPFEEHSIPTISICIVPEDDIVPMIGLAYSMQENEKIALLPSVYESVRYPERDTVDAIQVDAMRQVMLVVNQLISNLMTTMPEGVDWK
jgi:hypothetical protein